jgi:hypothetical protein
LEGDCVRLFEFFSSLYRQGIGGMEAQAPELVKTQRRVIPAKKSPPPKNPEAAIILWP